MFVCYYVFKTSYYVFSTVQSYDVFPIPPIPLIRHFIYQMFGISSFFFLYFKKISIFAATFTSKQ